MASIGLPGLNGFVGEMLSLAGMFKTHPLYAALGATGVVLGAWYLLTMLQHLLFGPLKEPHHDARRHGTRRARHDPARAARHRRRSPRRACWIGVRPQPLIDSMRPEIEALAALYDGPTRQRRGRRRGARPPRSTDRTPSARRHADRMPTPHARTDSNIKTRHCDRARELILLATVCVMLLLGPFLVDDAGKADAGREPAVDDPVAADARPSPAGCFCSCGRPSRSARRAVRRRRPHALRAAAHASRSGRVLVILLTRQIDDGSSAEAHACLLAILAGDESRRRSPTDLIGLFLALELVSIPTYVFLYLPRRDARDAGSGAQVLPAEHLLVGARAVRHELAVRRHGDDESRRDRARSCSGRGEPRPPAAALVQAALAILIAGLSFRIAAVPFHFYAPDVFQGVNSASAAMLSFVPKVAGFAALVRVLPSPASMARRAAGGRALPCKNLLAVLAVATMTLGNLLALRQQQPAPAAGLLQHRPRGLHARRPGGGRRRRTVGGVTALWFYLATYGLMTIGVFALLAGGRAPSGRCRPTPTCTGLSQIHPAIAVLLAVCLFSLTGLPPTAGFTGQAEPVHGELVVAARRGAVWLAMRDRRQRGDRAPGTTCG